MSVKDRSISVCVCLCVCVQIEHAISWLTWQCWDRAPFIAVLEAPASGTRSAKHQQGATVFLLPVNRASSKQDSKKKVSVI